MKTTLTLIALLLTPLTNAQAQSPAFVTPAVRAPRVEFHTFESNAAKSKVSYHLYTPEVYDAEKERRFPVLYWLHGSGGGLQGIAPVSAWFDGAISEGKIPPMLVVFPNGLASSMWCDSKDGAVPMETILIKELLPHIDTTFRTLAKHEGRIIEGFSMGGYGAARLGFKYPQLFGAVSILAGGPLDLDFAGPRATGNPAERERILKGTFGGDLDFYRSQNPITIAQQQAEAVRGKVRVRMAVGKEDNTGPLNRAYSEHLTKLNIAHTFTIVPSVNHDPLALLKGLDGTNWEFYRSTLLLAPLAALHAAQPASNLHPYVTAGDPNIGRAFRIACGDVTSSVVPMAAATALPNLPLNAKRWEAVSMRVVEVAGTRDVMPAQLLAAGLDYGISPIDAAMDSWNGASFLQPEAMKGALLTSLVLDEDGTLRCGGPYYEILTWTFGAWEHYLATGDRAFMKVALAATLGGLVHSERNEFDPKLNLFRGPAIIGDGISAYPDAWAEAVKGAGHVMRWPQLNPDKKIATGYGIPIHALSTQCMAYQAYRLAARMQRELGVPVDAALEEKAERLKVAINRHFWRTDTGTYRYLEDIYGGSDAQEGFGNSVAILFGIASAEQSVRIFEKMHITPQGIPYNWPVFPRYASAEGMTFGNHNGTIWPPVSALWAQATASSGRTDLFALELKKLADRGCRDSQFSEIYHPVTGEIYGGLQEGRTGRGGASMRAFIAARLGGNGEATEDAIAKLFPAAEGKSGISLWQSCARNLYTSTAYLRMVLHGLCGILLDTEGLSFSPSFPKGMSPVAVYELPYRQAALEIHIIGEGNEVKKLTINGQEARTIPTTATGKQVVRIEMADAGN